LLIGAGALEDPQGFSQEKRLAVVALPPRFDERLHHECSAARPRRTLVRRCEQLLFGMHAIAADPKPQRACIRELGKKFGIGESGNAAADIVEQGPRRRKVRVAPRFAHTRNCNYDGGLDPRAIALPDTPALLK
jgi:hypothetical protein